MIGTATQQTCRAYLNCRRRPAEGAAMPNGGIGGLGCDCAAMFRRWRACQPLHRSARTIAARLLDPHPSKAPASNPHSADACDLLVSSARGFLP